MSPALHRRRYLRTLGAGFALAVAGTARSRPATEPGVARETHLDGEAASAFSAGTRRTADGFALAGTRWVGSNPLDASKRAPVVRSLDGDGAVDWQWTPDLTARQSALDVATASDGTLPVGGVRDAGGRKAVTLDRIDPSGSHGWRAAVETDWEPFRVRVAEFVGSDRFAVGTTEWVGTDGVTALAAGAAALGRRSRSE